MKIKKILLPIVVVEIYIFVSFCIIEWLYNHEMLISINDIEQSNFWIWFSYNIILGALILAGAGFALSRKINVIRHLKLVPDKHKITYILFAIYIVMFFVIHDFSISGCSRWIYYLIFIAAEEEIVFRGYLFKELEKEVPIFIAIILSGLIWGSVHAFMPMITHEPMTVDPMSLIFREAFNGVGAGALFVLLYKKSDSLLVPILVHAILDYVI